LIEFQVLALIDCLSEFRGGNIERNVGLCMSEIKSKSRVVRYEGAVFDDTDPLTDLNIRVAIRIEIALNAFSAEIL
jgi:hypothetical protein